MVSRVELADLVQAFDAKGREYFAFLTVGYFCLYL